jgi:hypothetical protein
LRDSAIYEEEDRVYLLYSIVGESGIAIAKLRLNCLIKLHKLGVSLLATDIFKPVEINRFVKEILELKQQDGKVMINKIAEKVSEKLGLDKLISATE